MISERLRFLFVYSLSLLHSERVFVYSLSLLHSERPKLFTILAFLSATGLSRKLKISWACPAVFRFKRNTLGVKGKFF